MQIIFNGQLVAPSDPSIKISPLCEAVQYGNSVFESFRTYNGQPPSFIKRHWERLFQSAQTMRLPLPANLTSATLDNSLLTLLNTLDLGKDYRFKVLVNPEFWWITVHEWSPLSKSVYKDGVKVDDVFEGRELSFAKGASPLYPYYQTRHLETGMFETLYFSPTGNLLEGSVTSVIAVIDQVLITPDKDVLPGITVRRVLEAANQMGFKTKLAPISRTDLTQSSEILLTNAVKGLVPVRQWDTWERSSSQVYDRLKSEIQEL